MLLSNIGSMGCQASIVVHLSAVHITLFAVCLCLDELNICAVYLVERSLGFMVSPAYTSNSHFLERSRRPGRSNQPDLTLTN